MMPHIKSQAQREALIADCKADIEVLQERMKEFSDSPLAQRELSSQLLRQQISLAALEEVIRGFVDESGLNEGLGIVTQSALLSDDIAIYTAPPVPVLKPVVLPDLRQNVSGERYVWSDGVSNYRDDVIKAIRDAGYPIAGENE